MQLPGTISDRVYKLARDLTADYDKPFDKAQAIERYLRAEIKYNEQLPTPPRGIEKVDYILFTAKEGYCDYYASAMIVMLRSLGIPARLAAGFARGTYNSDLDTFHVVNADAHSWVEVFFPRYGWIEFEPTAAQPVIIRHTAPESDGSFASGVFPPGQDRDEIPDKPDNIPIDDESIVLSPFVFNIPWFGTKISISRGVVNGGIIFIGLVLIATVVSGGLWWRQQLSESTDNITKLYQRMVQMAAWMGVVLRSWQTPYEHASILQRKLPTHQHEVAEITHQYVYHTFRPSRTA